jgi:hypothetical protein
VILRPKTAVVLRYRQAIFGAYEIALIRYVADARFLQRISLHCKNRMFLRLDGLNIVNVRSTMLDQHRWFVPYIEIFAAEKLPWAATPAVHSLTAQPDSQEYAALIKARAKARNRSEAAPLTVLGCASVPGDDALLHRPADAAHKAHRIGWTQRAMTRSHSPSSLLRMTGTN